MRSPRLASIVLLGSAAITPLACGGDDLEPAGELVHELEASQRFPLVSRDPKLDLLLVIDDSSSMAEEQILLANNLANFIEVLEHDEVDIDYRVAVTTTDVGSPACDEALTTPAHGRLITSPCTQRLDDFVREAAEGSGEAVDARDVCTEVCSLDAIERTPTTVEGDAVPRPRPWIERIDGVSNLAAGVDTAEALSCVGLQGVGGCSFESPMEAMARALTRMLDENDPSYGFLRHDAVFMVLFVTDEVDCSATEAFAALVDGVGEPSSALCWDLGVECEGDPADYDACEPSEDPALQPMSRYFGLLDGIERQKQLYDPNAEVVVGLLGGVASDGNAYYGDPGEDVGDQAFAAAFGIGPGCKAPYPGDPNRTIRAAPPVRLRALVDAYTPHNLFSSCDADYSSALYALAPTLIGYWWPACFEYCAEDTDRSTPELDPACIVKERPVEGGEATHIRECLRDASGYVIDADTHDYTMPADDVNICYALRTDDQGLTASTADDMSYECSDRGHNLEFAVARRPGAPGVDASELVVTCALTESPELFCPGLDGH